MNIEFFNATSCGLRSVTASCEYATVQLKQLGQVIDSLRPVWLVENGGDWPDAFTLLNRYLRTGIEPECFEDERWEG